VKREGTAEVIVTNEGRSLGPRGYVLEMTEGGLAVEGLTVELTPAEAVLFEREAYTLRVVLDDMKVNMRISGLVAETSSVEFEVLEVDRSGGGASGGSLFES
jgi:hypothetical protein